MTFLRKHALALSVTVALLVAPIFAHLFVVRLARLEPPKVLVAVPGLVDQGALRIAGLGYASRHDGLWEVRLRGSAAQIGVELGRLLGPEMVHTEQRVMSMFDRFVPSRWAQPLLLDLARLRFRHLDEAMASDRLDELAGLALSVQPDPLAGFLPTYQRFVYLNALYDIALTYERSPLVGCTTFVTTDQASYQGHTLLARNFDFDVDDVFDQLKVVYVVLKDGTIPFVSIAWPGLVGVVSGMNAAGVAIVVHGGRAGELHADGEPMIQSLRFVLEHAGTARQAADILADRRPMVSHIVITADADGAAFVVERVPGRPAYRYQISTRAVVTNHLVGPSADDPKNRYVMDRTSTVQRKLRGEQLLARLHHPATVFNLVHMLRDRCGVNDAPLALGDRRAIGALIAAHGVVMDVTARKIWVSEAPHLLGKFVEFDLKPRFEPNYVPSVSAPAAPSIAADPLLTSGEYSRWKRTHHSEP